MKRILLLTTLVVGLVAAGLAQRKTPKEVKKAEIAQHKAEKREDKREKEIINDQRKDSKELSKELRKSTGIRKDGKPDMRLAENQRKAAEEARKRQEQAARERERQMREAAKVRKTPVHPNINPQPVNRTADRVVGTDAKGRTIYQGPRGGRYYLNSHGNKEYIK